MNDKQETPQDAQDGRSAPGTPGGSSEAPIAQGAAPGAAWRFRFGRWESQDGISVDLSGTPWLVMTRPAGIGFEASIHGSVFDADVGVGRGSTRQKAADDLARRLSDLGAAIGTLGLGGGK